jgi:hypothetical protein
MAWLADRGLDYTTRHIKDANGEIEGVLIEITSEIPPQLGIKEGAAGAAFFRTQNLCETAGRDEEHR